MMSIVVDAASFDGFRISSHAKVRYLERYVSQRTVRAIRRRSSNDASALETLAGQYPVELDNYSREISCALDRLKQRLGTIPFPRFTLRIGTVAVAVVGETCVTTLPRRVERPIRRRRRSKKRQWK